MGKNCLKINKLLRPLFEISVFTWLTKPVWLTGFLKKNGFGYLNLNNYTCGYCRQKYCCDNTTIGIEMLRQ